MADKITRGIRTTDEASILPEIELGSFAQNLVTLESILFRANQELASAAVNPNRLNVYLSEMYSMQQELISQQARAVAARGIASDDVQRLQSLLSGPLVDIVTAADRHIATAQAKLNALESGGAPPNPPIDSAASQGDDEQMEARIAKLEADVASIKIDVGIIKANGATKSDIADLKTTVEGVKTTVAEAKTAIIIWAVGAILVAQLLPAVKEFLIPAQKTLPSAQATVPPSASPSAAPAKP